MWLWEVLTLAFMLGIGYLQAHVAYVERKAATTAFSAGKREVRAQCTRAEHRVQVCVILFCISFVFYLNGWLEWVDGVQFLQDILQFFVLTIVSLVAALLVWMVIGWLVSVFEDVFFGPKR